VAAAADTEAIEGRPAGRRRRVVDLAIGIALGLAIGIAVIAALVHSSEGAVDAPGVDAGKPAQHSAARAGAPPPASRPSAP
jgi:hypothetical protein